jgi:hypothetical protein
LVKNVESNMPAFQAGIQGSLHSESFFDLRDFAETLLMPFLGERRQIGLGDRMGRQERRWGITPCSVSSRHEHAIGDARVKMHVVVERRAEAVQEGDGDEPRACGCEGVGR